MKVPISLSIFVTLWLALISVSASSDIALSHLDSSSATRISNDTFVYHFVGFRFVNATLEQQQQVTDLYHSLLVRCPYIVDMKGGVPNSKEGFQQDLDQGWVTIFRNVQDRDYFVGRPFTYPYDPAHDQFKQFVGPFLRRPIETGLVVVDFTNVPFTVSNSSLFYPTDSRVVHHSASDYLGVPVQAGDAPGPNPNVEPIPPRTKNDTLIYHFVSFRFFDNVTQAQRDEVGDKYRQLFALCPYIVDFKGGIPNSHEGFQQMMDQAYVLTFKSIADRDYFVGRPFSQSYDPYHDAFKAMVGPLLRKPIDEGLIVVDFQNINPVPSTVPYTFYSWNFIDFNFPDLQSRQAYISSQSYKQVMPAGIKVWLDPRDNSTTYFVSFPRWMNVSTGVPATFATLEPRVSFYSTNSLSSTGPVFSPYPDWSMNTIGDRFALQSVLGFEIDSRNLIWILDQGRIAFQPVLKGAPKLVIMDLMTGGLVLMYMFNETLCPPTTCFLNDIVIDEARNFAYITDSGLTANSSDHPGLIVYSFEGNEAWRVLDNDVSTVSNKSFTFQVNQTDIYPNDPNQVGADGIALTGDFNYLFWCPLNSPAVFRLPTCLLRALNSSLITDEELRKEAVHVLNRPGNADGLIISNSLHGQYIAPSQRMLDRYAKYGCTWNDLVAYEYELIATDLVHNTIWNISGNLAHSYYEMSADIISTYDELAIPSTAISFTPVFQPNMSRDADRVTPNNINNGLDNINIWPDTLAFDHLGSVMWMSNRLPYVFHFMSLDFENDTNFRLWGQYIDRDSYLFANIPSVHPSPDNHSNSKNLTWLYIFLPCLFIFVIGVSVFLYYRRKEEVELATASRSSNYNQLLS